MHVIIKDQDTGSQRADNTKKVWEAPRLLALVDGKDIHGGAGGSGENSGIWEAS
jgi:hypothetical protein